MKTQEGISIQLFYQLAKNPVNPSSIIKDSIHHFIREKLAKKCG